MVEMVYVWNTLTNLKLIRVEDTEVAVACETVSESGLSGSERSIDADKQRQAGLPQRLKALGDNLRIRFVWHHLLPVWLDRRTSVEGGG